MFNLIKKQHQYLFKQTNQHRKLSKIFVFFCFIFLFFQINQIKSTYTNGFIDHKTLLTPKQLITNTLKQIKPKFNPRYASSSKTNDQKKQKLNVYDSSDGIKTARKTNNKEQVPQSTYYYTDYKPIVKKLIPMKPECPETGRTVCKDAKAYPSESILNLILEAKANKFNFSSLFVDESQNSDMPNLPEIENVISKCGQQNDKEYDKVEKTHNNRKTTKNNNENYNRKNNYDNNLKVNNYKRPDSSSVYYDNENTYSTHNTLNDNYPTNNYEQQRINDNSYDKIDPIDQTKQYQVDDKSNNQQQINYQSGEQLPPSNQPPIQQRQIYQQPQSSIKFEQHYNRQPTQIRHDKPIQDLNYRNPNQNNYYNGRNNQRSENPFKTRVTIIPFIHYITQIPTNGYRLNSDKHLIDTITQSLQHNPLNNYTPDAWLPIKAYTTDDLQQKEIDEHLASDRIGSDEFSNDELTPEYSTLNYRDKRSICTDEEDVTKKLNDDQVEKKDKDKNKKIIKKDDDDNSLTRVKKQAGFEDEPEELCQTKRLFITPKAALNDKSEWRYIVNVGERDSRLKQVIKVDVCANPNGPCSNQISLPFGYVAVCKQKYIKKKLLAIDPDGQSTSTENFFIPSCCVCEINRVNQKK